MPAFIILSSLAAVAFAFILRKKILGAPQGTKEMLDIHQAIKEGAKAYLKRQYKVVSVVAVIIAIAIIFFFDWKTSLGFLIGAAASGLAGYLGMLTSVSSNVRVTEAAKKGIAPAFRLAFLGGAVTGFLVVGLGLLSVSVFWFLFKDLNSLLGLGFGGSLISVFSRLGGGIYTKGADVGADLVGKVEAGIPEDDPRNPAVIADNVGDNVGDCAGMAADLFETYAVTAIAAMLLANLIFPQTEIFILFPLLIGACSIISSIIGVFFVRLKKENIMGALYKGVLASAIISVALFALIAKLADKQIPAGNLFFWAGKIQTANNWLYLFLAALTGIIITFLMILITEYYTAKKFRPVKSIAQASNSGHATNIIMGLAVSLESTALPIIVITAGTLLSWWFFGLYGIAAAVTAMLSLTGIIVAIDSFGPITDNAGGIAEMAGVESQVREITDKLDAVGNTTKAITKGYAIASAGLAALTLFAAFTAEIENLGQVVIFELQNPVVLAGILIGALLPFLFSSMAMLAVGKTASKIVEEVRRQFREIKGLMERTAKPDYAKAVDIATRSALKQMILPALFPIATTIAVAFILGPEALGGLLIGVIATGLFLAISMTSGGAAWDNAKKYIEEGNYGGKGSPAHQAAVTGDTVGDPYKDTAGPAINPMIKVVNIVALVLVRFL